jgi:hypothetical protein
LPVSGNWFRPVYRGATLNGAVVTAFGMGNVPDSTRKTCAM